MSLFDGAYASDSSDVRRCVPCAALRRLASTVARRGLAIADDRLARESTAPHDRGLPALAQRGLGYNHCCDTQPTGEPRLLQRLGRSGMWLCVDVDASVGAYPTAILELSAAHRVAFQPLPAAELKLQALAASFPGRLRVEQAGVADASSEPERRCGDAECVPASFSSPAQAIGYVAAAASRSSTAKLVGLDDFLLAARARERPQTIDLLEIHPEGLKYQTLVGAQRTLRELAPRAIQIEFRQHPLHAGHTRLAFAEGPPQYDVVQWLPYWADFRRMDPSAPSSNVFH